MKRVLIVTSGYFPGRKYGGPPVSVDNLCSLLKESVDFFIVTHNHDMGDKQPYTNIHDGWNDCGNASVMYLNDEDYNSSFFEKAIKNTNPDYIYLQSLFQDCVFACLKLAKKHNVKVVLAPRGELCSGAFKKKYKKLPYIAMLRIMGLLKQVQFQSTSEEETMAINRYLGAPKERIHYLTNIPSIPGNLQPHNVKEGGRGRFIFVSRILWKKNLLKAISYLNSVKGDVRFDIYGPKEDENYWQECESVIKQLPSNVTVEYKGVLSHDEIHKTFNLYDALLFPTLSENYGHVIAEALVSGCVPIISTNTPWCDINEAGAGWALSLLDDNGFVDAIQEIIDMDEVGIQKYRTAIATYLDKKLRLEDLTKEYLSLFKVPAIRNNFRYK